MNYIEVPAQPTEWSFIDDLKKTVDRKVYWTRSSENKDEINLKKNGYVVIKNFPDTEKVLDTAYDDLEKFFKEAGIASKKNGFKIITEKKESEAFEKYIIKISKDSCTVISGDTEGIRRGIFHIEDMLSSADGPFLKEGETERESWCKTRVSRCFFGPIKRPPLNRDELLDNVDYYPDEYLNRLAHEGINGLWLTIAFRDLARTSLFSGHAPDAEKRLAKLNRTVTQCLRYGIKIYIFCIEPVAFPDGDPMLAKYPELGGAKRYERTMFCPSSETAQKYLFEAVNIIFTKVPGLGGMINISLGERATTCISAVDEKGYSNCPVCGKKEPWEILYASLSAMEKGMHAANPDAKLISWLYVPLNNTGHAFDFVNDIARHVPENVILQYNFESGGEKTQLNKPRFAGDYWLSYTGPSDIFREVAENAVAKKSQVSAKLQVSCSHEVASVPVVPVPAQLYKKYQAMHDLGVSCVMQCWYFGNYPGIMNKAAGMLAFEDFSRGENKFLEELAKVEWGPYYREVADAWKYFTTAYENYPVNVLFQYYGPMHDGPVWPLHLKPVDKPLSPTWKIDYPPSGDRIGECIFGSHTLNEAVILCRDMADNWDMGVATLKNLKKALKNSPDRLKDIALAEALGIQFRSGYNILRFYALRNELIESDSMLRLVILDKMKQIVKEEISLSEKLAELCAFDSRLGFHSEAEGYKYFPEKLKWRCGLLKSLLEEDFPETERIIKNGLPLFQEFSNNNPSGKTYVCGCGKIENCERLSWCADFKDNTVIVKATVPIAKDAKEDNVYVLFEGGRFNPISFFSINKNADYHYSLMKDPNKNCSCVVTKTEQVMAFTLNISLNTFAMDNLKYLRFNIMRDTDDGKGNKKSSAWVEMELMKMRLAFGSFNSHDMGILKLS